MLVVTGDLWEHWGKEVYMVPMDKLTVLALIGQLTLALRHPENKGPSSVLVRELVSKFVRLIKDDPLVDARVLEEWKKEKLV